MTTSAPALVARAQPMRAPGTYEIDIEGDASGLYMICKLFKEFRANELKWSASMPTYPPGTNVEAALDVESLDFGERTHTPAQAKYHLSTRELKEAWISIPGFVLYVKSRSGELDFVFSDPHYYYYYWTYRTVDIRGRLKGDVVFFIDIDMPPQLVSSFHYTGRALTIDVHIGT
ncbi:MAG: hypothetical protein ACE5OV_03330 [Candidatus Bathyarchaeia archaeon]